MRWSSALWASLNRLRRQVQGLGRQTPLGQTRDDGRNRGPGRVFLPPPTPPLAAMDAAALREQNLAH